jgi:hypothetical protein
MARWRRSRRGLPQHAVGVPLEQVEQGCKVLAVEEGGRRRAATGARKVLLQHLVHRRQQLQQGLQRVRRERVLRPGSAVQPRSVNCTCFYHHLKNFSSRCSKRQAEPSLKRLLRTTASASMHIYWCGVLVSCKPYKAQENADAVGPCSACCRAMFHNARCEHACTSVVLRRRSSSSGSEKSSASAGPSTSSSALPLMPLSSQPPCCVHGDADVQPHGSGMTAYQSGTACQLPQPKQA